MKLNINLNSICWLVVLSFSGILASCSQGSHTRKTPAQMEFDEAYLEPGSSRTFQVRYLARAQEIPGHARRLRLWWPVPQNSTLQKITELEFSGPAEPRLGRDGKYGNLIAYVEIADPPSEVEFEMSFICRRRETRVILDALKSEGSDPPGAFRIFLDPSRLVVIDDQIRRLSEEATRGKEGSLEKARAIYDRVRSIMTYDKSGTGWGRGDSIFACRVGKGNCTDFHALFNSFCRAAGIPAGFEIGLYLPYEESKGEDWQIAKSGYHCWAAFRVPGRTWVPVDASEGDKLAGREDFFFGGYTANRVALSAGRDIILDPPQEGEPLNYFLQPHAEVDGVEHEKTSKVWYFKNL